MAVLITFIDHIIQAVMKLRLGCMLPRPAATQGEQYIIIEFVAVV